MATLPQRIGESASGLLKETFNQASPRAATGTLASLNTDNVKAASSSSSTGTGESSWALRSSPQSTLIQGETFRSDGKGDISVRPHSQFVFDEFLAGLNVLEHESKLARDEPALSVDQQSGCPLEIAEDNRSRVQERKTWKMQDENKDCAGQYNDGAAVVALLSDPALTMDEEPGSTLNLENDRGKGRNYKRLQTENRSAKSVDAIQLSNPLDLVPDFSARWNSSQASLAFQKDGYEGGHLLDPRQRDVQPWIDILDKYHDEVWSEMLPLVREAREEFKAANENLTCHQDGPAIQRLKMVLQHLVNPSSR